MENIERAQQSHSTRPGLCTVKLRLIGGWLTKTMDNLEKLVNEIFKDKVYILSHLKIVRGSVIVTYCAPLSEADPLAVLSLEKSSFVTKVGVLDLVVGDTIVVKSDSSDFTFDSSLPRAITHNDPNMLGFLRSINISPDTADDRGLTALMYASYYNDDKALSLLLKSGVDPNLQAYDGKTSLYIASWHGYVDVVALLLKANANPNLHHVNGATPLYIASQNAIKVTRLSSKTVRLHITRELRGLTHSGKANNCLDRG